MYVVKRNGQHESVKYDKIAYRIKCLCYGLDSKYINPILVAQKVIAGVYPGVSTEQLDHLAAETASVMTSIHPDYGILAGRIASSNLQKKTSAHKKFSQCITRLYTECKSTSKDDTGEPLISHRLYEVVKANASRLDAAIVNDRDDAYDYFAFKTLEKSYLLRGKDGVVVERIQHMLMRVAVGIHMEDIDAAIETYNLMSTRVFIHATPTLYNAGLSRPQMSSCFLLTMKGDSIGGIYETLSLCAKISKYAGGVGLSVHDIRAKGSYIAGTNGNSNGLVPMLRVFDATARYVDQGGGKRKGSFAIYLEPWHADIEDFLELKKNHGKEEMKARDLFYALWVPDLFMRRVEENGDWTLFCPNEAKGLSDCWGEEFESLYEKYVREGLGRKTMKAQDLWFQILNSQVETGTPYMLYKDSCNRKSNHQHLGTIKSSNLCTEIIQFTSPDEVAVCNLASISLKAFLFNGKFDFDYLVKVVGVIVRNLNKVIDNNYYPVEEARNSNYRHRPIGLGVQGMADLFMEMRLPYDSVEAQELNRQIAETIYYGACKASIDLAEELGYPYPSFAGSPMSKGIFQFDMWNVKPSERHDWPGLKERLLQHGIYNSLLVAPMPTASTSQILGNTEAFEPISSNLYTRRVLSGDFVCVNKYLIKDLIALGMWNMEMKNLIVGCRGSIQSLTFLPQEIRDLYKTVWELKQRTLLDMAAARGPFIDQSQSLNVHLPDPTVGKLTSVHFHGWRLGLKTGMYYLRTRPKADPIQFTLEQDIDTMFKMFTAVPPPESTLTLTRQESDQSTVFSEDGESGGESKGVELKYSEQRTMDLNVVGEACPVDAQEEGCLSCGS